MNSVNLAKVILLSSFTTILIVCSLLFAFRAEILSYIEKSIAHETVEVQENQLAHSDKLVDTIQKVNPAVVSIIVTKDVAVYERYYETYRPWGGFGSFTVPRIKEKGTEEVEVGGGSGFIVSNDGLIVTNRHVVEDDAAKYTVLLNDGTSYQTEVLAKDPQFDIAILRIAEPLEGSLSYLSFGNSDDLELGETVIAIGNALAEFRNSVSVGVISGLLRSVVATDEKGQSEQLDRVIQTDAAINPGNSGGPLLNIEGDVVGVNVAVSKGADNIGFALPGNMVEHIVESVKEHGEIVRPYLGVRYLMVDEAIYEQYSLSVNYGALVVSGANRDEFAVAPGSPADLAGLTEGDIILKIDEIDLAGRDLVTVLREKEVGDEVDLLVLKDGVEVEISVVLEKAI